MNILSFIVKRRTFMMQFLKIKFVSFVLMVNLILSVVFLPITKDIILKLFLDSSLYRKTKTFQIKRNSHYSLLTNCLNVRHIDFTNLFVFLRSDFRTNFWIKRCTMAQDDILGLINRYIFMRNFSITFF